MEITRRCDYACCIIRAAYKSGESYISIADVAEQEDIPYPFARSIKHEFVKAGFLKTIRGVRGGLTLNCNPHETTLYEVFEALQGPVALAPCSQDDGFCDRSSGCAFNAAWRAADILISDLFGSITLADLFDKGARHPVIKGILDSERS